MSKDLAVVLCSGGLNSAVAACATAAEQQTALLHVKFGHRAARRESDCFEALARSLAPHQQMILDMPHLAQIGGSSRLSRKIQMEDALAIGEGGARSYIPGLVGTLLGAAFQWASVIGATRIVLGIAEELGAPSPRIATLYPDYAREFLELSRHAYACASPKKTVNIDVPLIDLDRTKIIKLGQRLGTPFEATWSCIANNDEPCGACIGCATRIRGFAEAGIPDPAFARRETVPRA